jgi:hypothetical protein
MAPNSRSEVRLPSGWLIFESNGTEHKIALLDVDDLIWYSVLPGVQPPSDPRDSDQPWFTEA